MLTLTVFQHAEFVDEPPAAPCAAKTPTTRFSSIWPCMWGAKWLFSKDAALLKLAKRARQRGTEVLTLPQWTPVP